MFFPGTLPKYGFCRCVAWALGVVVPSAGLIGFGVVIEYVDCADAASAPTARIAIEMFNCFVAIFCPALSFRFTPPGSASRAPLANDWFARFFFDERRSRVSKMPKTQQCSFNHAPERAECDSRSHEMQRNAMDVRSAHARINLFGSDFRGEEGWAARRSDARKTSP